MYIKEDKVYSQGFSHLLNKDTLEELEKLKQITEHPTERKKFSTGVYD